MTQHSPTTPPAHTPTTQPAHASATEPAHASATEPAHAPSTQPAHAPSTQPAHAPSTQPAPAPSTQPAPATRHRPYATIRPWVDPIVDQRGHDPRSAYVERYWLGVIGPTATWIMRRFADEFDCAPDGFTIDLEHTAVTMGLSFTRGAHSPFGKALHRCVMFGLAQPSDTGYLVRRRFPTVARRHLERLPDDVRAAHDDWARLAVHADRRELEARLVAAGIPPAAAARAGEAVALAS